VARRTTKRTDGLRRSVRATRDRPHPVARSGRFIRLLTVVGAVLVSGCGSTSPQVFSRAAASKFFKKADGNGYSTVALLAQDMKTWNPPLSHGAIYRQ
jgi:hypothetical protein